MLQSVGAPLRHLVDEDNSSNENTVILLGQKWPDQKTEILTNIFYFQANLVTGM